MTEIMGEFIVEFTRFVDYAKRLGDPRLVPVSLGWDSLNWGVSLRGHIASGPVVYFTSSGTIRVDYHTTSTQVTTKS